MQSHLRSKWNEEALANTNNLRGLFSDQKERTNKANATLELSLSLPYASQTIHLSTLLYKNPGAGGQGGGGVDKKRERFCLLGSLVFFFSWLLSWTSCCCFVGVFCFVLLLFIFKKWCRGCSPGLAWEGRKVKAVIEERIKISITEHYQSYETAQSWLILVILKKYSSWMISTMSQAFIFTSIRKILLEHLNKKYGQFCFHNGTWFELFMAHSL